MKTKENKFEKIYLDAVEVIMIKEKLDIEKKYKNFYPYFLTKIYDRDKRYLEIMKLSYIDKKSTKEIANIFHLSYSRIYSFYETIIRMLRRNLYIIETCNIEPLINEPIYDLFKFIRENFTKEQIYKLNIKILSDKIKYGYKCKTIGEFINFIIDNIFMIYSSPSKTAHVIDLFIKLGIYDDIINKINDKIINITNDTNYSTHYKKIMNNRLKKFISKIIKELNLYNQIEKQKMN